MRVDDAIMGRPLRVAYVLTQDRGGPADVTVTLARTLDESEDVDVRLFGPRPARGAETIEHLLEPVSVASKGSVRAMRATRAAILAWRPDVVHAQDRRSGLLCARLGSTRRRAHRPVVLHTYHGVPDDVTSEWFVDGSGARPSAYTLATLTADAVVARQVERTVVPSPSMGTFLHRRLHVPAQRIVHVDNGLTLPPASPPRHVRRLLTVGLLVERKAVGDLLDALALGLRQGLPGLADLTLQIAGDGPLRSPLEQRAARPDLAGRVSFLGFRSDVPQLLATADAVVLPSHMEQQPLALIEAMGAGKLLLATDTGGVRDMLRDVGAGAVVVPPGDITALARGLSQLARTSDPTGAGTAVAAAARSRFSAEASAKTHLSLYRSLVPRV
jgi:glycosyltransferase involved in cell wall biosynthesis